MLGPSIASCIPLLLWLTFLLAKAHHPSVILPAKVVSSSLEFVFLCVRLICGGVVVVLRKWNDLLKLIKLNILTSQEHVVV